MLPCTELYYAFYTVHYVSSRRTYLCYFALFMSHYAMPQYGTILYCAILAIPPILPSPYHFSQCPTLSAPPPALCYLLSAYPHFLPHLAHSSVSPGTRPSSHCLMPYYDILYYVTIYKYISPLSFLLTFPHAPYLFYIAIPPLFCLYYHH